MSLREKIADRLAYFDECGPGPVSRGEYLEDADEVIAMVREYDATLAAPFAADGGVSAARIAPEEPS